MKSAVELGAEQAKIIDTKTVIVTEWVRWKCQYGSQGAKQKAVRPQMEACGIDVFETARLNGFQIDTKKETFGKWNYFALVLLE